jgi:hypothetical protein
LQVEGNNAHGWGSRLTSVSVATTPIDPGILGHAEMVAQAMLGDGMVVPLLGAGVNLCGRPADEGFLRGKNLPNGSELAAELAKKVQRLPPAILEDLLRVSQCVDHERGWRVLYDTLHQLFDADYPPTSFHRFLARVPKLIAQLPNPPRATHQLIVTTNYDDVLERAFDAEEEEYDLVWYVARGEDTGSFTHRAPDGTTQVIEDPETYVKPLSLSRRTVILKIHGAVHRSSKDNGDADAPSSSERDSYVITEDNYIDYLTRTDIRKLIPKGLLAVLRMSSILFIGYGMRDWNLRAIFHRIWQEEELGYRSWAIRRPLDDLPAEKRSDAAEVELHRQRKMEQDLEESFWSARGVKIFDADLAVYCGALEQVAEEMVGEPAAP